MKTVSASDISRYAYCPKSWYLSKEGHKGSGEELTEGVRRHESFSSDLKEAKSHGEKSREEDRMVVVFSIVAALLAFYGIFIVNPGIFFYDEVITARIYSAFAVIWLLAALGFFAHSRSIKFERVRDSKVEKRSRVSRESGIIVLASAIVLLLNTLSLYYPIDPLWAPILLFMALLWLIASIAAIYIMRENLHSRNAVITIVSLSAGAVILASNAITLKLRYEMSGITVLTSIIIFESMVMMFIGVMIVLYSLLSGWRVIDLAEDPMSNLNAARREERKAAIYLSLISIVLSINSVTLMMNLTIQVAFILVFAAVIWIVAAFASMLLSIRARNISAGIKKRYGLVGDEVLDYIDDMASTDLLESEKYGIRGRPDAIVYDSGYPIPIELKTGRVPAVPRFSHIMQVGTYCLLVEEAYGKRPPYGIIKYQGGGKGNDRVINAEFKIAYDDKMKELILSTVEDMRAIMEGRKEAHRNHEKVAKCRHCSRREWCDERLA